MDFCEILSGIIVMVLGLGGFIISIMTVQSCEFIAFGGELQSQNLALGLFHWEALTCIDDDCDQLQEISCRAYTNEDEELLIGSYQKAGRAMAGVAAAFGGLAILINFFQVCVPLPEGLWKLMSALYAFALVAQLLTFLFFYSDLCVGEEADAIRASNPDYKCKVGSGAVMSIVAAVLYMFAGIMIGNSEAPEAMIDCYGMPKTKESPEKEGSEMENGGQVVVVQQTAPAPNTVTETINGDGSKTVTSEYVLPDGTKTFSTTVLPPTTAV